MGPAKQCRNKNREAFVPWTLEILSQLSQKYLFVEEFPAALGKQGIYTYFPMGRIQK